MFNSRKGVRSRVASRRFLTRGAAAAALVIFGVAISASRDGVLASPQAQASQARAKKYVATRAITLDKQTGAVRMPTAAETQELVDNLVALLDRSSEGLAEVPLPSGGVAVNLEGRYAPAMLARPNADGTTEVRCVTTFEEAADFLGLIPDPAQK
jgi:hypothetical protein